MTIKLMSKTMLNLIFTSSLQLLSMSTSSTRLLLRDRALLSMSLRPLLQKRTLKKPKQALSPKKVRKRRLRPKQRTYLRKSLTTSSLRRLYVTLASTISKCHVSVHTWQSTSSMTLASTRMLLMKVSVK